MNSDELCKWLRQNSSGIYRPAADAADEIERLLAENAALRAALAVQPEPEVTPTTLEEMRAILATAPLVQPEPAQPAPVQASTEPTPTLAQLNSACMSYRHDFGLMSEDEQERLRWAAKEWLHAWRKEFEIAAPQAVQASEPVAQLPPNLAWRDHNAAIDAKALATATEISLMWGQDRSQFVSRIQVAVTDAMLWLKPALAAPQPAAAVLSGWQPIETAPKDGMPILVANDERGAAWIAQYKPVYCSGYKPSNPWFSLMLNCQWHPNPGGSFTPTRWMPLPDATIAARAAVGDSTEPKK